MSGPFGSKNTRNFGWGKNSDYAGRQALDQRYGSGHFATQAAHGDRWQQAADFWRAEGMRDVRKVDQVQLENYARYVASRVSFGDIGRAYGQNLISTANVVLEAMRGDRAIRVSPSAFVGERCAVRMRAPAGMDRAQVSACAAELRSRGLDRAASLLELARDGGFRLREGSLADLPRLNRESRRGTCNIQDGCKGGRDAPRWIPASLELRASLGRALDSSSAGARNLLMRDERLIEFFRGEVKVARNILHTHGLKGYHDLRSAYACERYRTLTGHDAPVMGGKIRDRAGDLAARKTIAFELGHGRVDVVASYIGGRE